MLTCRSVKSRLLWLVAFMSLLLSAVGLVGLGGIAAGNSMLREALAEREAVELLAGIDHALMESRVHVAAARLDGTAEGMALEVPTLRSNIAKLENVYQRFLAVDADADGSESVAVRAYDDAVSAFVDATLRPTIAALESGDARALAALWDGEAGAYTNTYKRVKAAAKALSAQFKAASEEDYRAAVTDYQRTRNLTFAAMVLGIGLAIAIGLLIARRIAAALQRLSTHLDRIAAGGARSGGGLRRSGRVAGDGREPRAHAAAPA